MMQIFLEDMPGECGLLSFFFFQFVHLAKMDTVVENGCFSLHSTFCLSRQHQGYSCSGWQEGGNDSSCHFPSAHLFPVGKEQKWYDNTRVTGVAANLQEPVDWMNSTHLLVDNIGSYVHKEAGGRFRLCTPESTSVRFLFILENGSLT